jgi:hypothetical protein
VNEQLTELSEKLRLNAKRAQTLVSTAGEARIEVRPMPDSWSAAECLVHLTISTEVFFPTWRAALAGARAKGLVEKGRFRMDIAGAILNWFLRPSTRIRTSAPAALLPTASGHVLAAFLRSQDRLLEVLSDSSGLALDRIKIASPVNSRVHYSVWSSFRIMDTHQRRHLLQAEHAVGVRIVVDYVRQKTADARRRFR